ncbi:MAG: patatin-like phospholipase family protein [Candidatus Promineifilaceae bacterium]
MTFRILCLDGGGIRGIYSMVLLERIAKEVPNLMKKIDMFSGTSTGGIIGLGLADGYTPAEGVELYRKFGKKVFKDSRFDNLLDLGRLIGAQYSTRPLKKILQETYRSKTLAELRTKKGKLVLIPTFDLDAVKDDVRSWKPKFFHNFPGEDSDGGELLVDVALRTSAAPSYFPTYQGYIDGGVVTNNPSMGALAQALNEGKLQSEIRLLSIGTGRVAQYIRGKNLDWGQAQWAKTLLPIMFDGLMGVASYQCHTILGKSGFHRLDPQLKKAAGLDEVDKIEDLVKEAGAVDIEETIAWVKTHFMT